jgi:hypothetical protein
MCADIHGSVYDSTLYAVRGKFCGNEKSINADKLVEYRNYYEHNKFDYIIGVGNMDKFPRSIVKLSIRKAFADVRNYLNGRKSYPRCYFERKSFYLSFSMYDKEINRRGRNGNGLYANRVGRLKYEGVLPEKFENPFFVLYCDEWYLTTRAYFVSEILSQSVT